MPFPLNRVVLTELGKADFLALLAMTETSASLSHFIYERVLTVSSLCTFLRENQYVLHNDVYGILINSQEKARLIRAFEVLRRRHGQTFYESSFHIMGPLLGRIPEASIDRLFHPFSLLLGKEGKIPKTLTENGSPGYYTISDLLWDIAFTFFSSWMHAPGVMFSNCEKARAEFYQLPELAGLCPQDDPLFCRRYIKDIHACLSAGRAFSQVLPGDETALDTIKGIEGVRVAFREAGIHSYLLKKYLQSYMQLRMDSVYLDRQDVLPATFQKIFELPGWMELWTPDELGWWLSLGLTQFGPESIGPLIENSFRTHKQAALWLFLGAHEWLHIPGPDEDMRATNRDPESKDRTCCTPLHWGMEADYMEKLIASFSKSDRIWLIQQIVRYAPEYGQCLSLGGNLYTYFVVRDLPESDVMLATLLDEIIASPLQYAFEHSIGLAISYQSMLEGKVPEISDGTRRYASKLMRRNRELYGLLSCVHVE